MIQSAERRKRACATAADLREQRASPWEQLWDDENGRLYFFFKVSSITLQASDSSFMTCSIVGV